MNTQSNYDGTHNEVQWHDVQGLLRTGYGQYKLGQLIRIEVFEHTSVDALKAWLSNLVNRHQLEKMAPPSLGISHADFIHTASFFEFKSVLGQEVKLNIAMSVLGLQRLGLPSTALNSFPLEFIDGMGSERAAALLGDQGENHYSRWEWGGTNHVPHFALLAYSNSEEQMRTLVQQLEIDNIGTAQVLNTRLEGFEHFGFRDGQSNPVIRKAHRSLDAATRNPEGTLEPGEFIFGYPDQRGLLPVSPTTPQASDREDLLPRAQAERESPDDLFRLDRKDLGHNGSFLVIRQFEQHVERFDTYLHSQNPENPELIGAKMMGRWRNGTPLTLSASETPPSIANDSNLFHYQGVDSHGIRCPLGAHIRRANPRDAMLADGSASFEIANRHRILRRGRLYEEGETKGLLFICLNVSISRQFEHIQSNWINSTHFAHEYETDPVIGAREFGDGKFTIPTLPMNKRIGSLPDFVTVKGGCYFFLPSLTALRFLSS